MFGNVDKQYRSTVMISYILKSERLSYIARFEKYVLCHGNAKEHAQNYILTKCYYRIVQVAPLLPSCTIFRKTK